jgi:hypothetical protein
LPGDKSTAFSRVDPEKEAPVWGNFTIGVKPQKLDLKSAVASSTLFAPAEKLKAAFPDRRFDHLA